MQGDEVLDSWLRQMKVLEVSIKNYNTKLKELRSKKKEFEVKIYERMKKKHIDTYSGINIKKVTPKAKTQRKKAAEKKQDAIELFSRIGVSDPLTLYEKFIETQKPPPQ